MILSISILTFVILWMAYEIWRSPVVKENQDGSYTTIKPTKKLSDIFKRKV